MSDDYPDFKGIPPPPRPKASEFDVLEARAKRERMEKFWRGLWRATWVSALLLITLLAMHWWVSGK